MNIISKQTLQWRHNGRDGVSNHQTRHCLLNRLFRCRSKKTSMLCVTGLCAVNSPVTGEFAAQRASYAENVSLWWRHHGIFNIIVVSVKTFSMCWATRWPVVEWPKLHSLTSPGRSDNEISGGMFSIKLVESRSYVTGIVAGLLRRYLSDMDVIFQKWYSNVFNNSNKGGNRGRGYRFDNIVNPMAAGDQGPVLLTWVNFNFTMDT